MNKAIEQIKKRAEEIFYGPITGDGDAFGVALDYALTEALAPLEREREELRVENGELRKRLMVRDTFITAHQLCIQQLESSAAKVRGNVFSVFKCSVSRDSGREIVYTVEATTPEDAQQLAFALDGGWGCGKKHADAGGMLALAQAHTSVESLITTPASNATEGGK